MWYWHEAIAWLFFMVGVVFHFVELEFFFDGLAHEFLEGDDLLCFDAFDAGDGVVQHPELFLEKSVSQESAKIGDKLFYTIIITNKGNVTLTNKALLDNEVILPGSGLNGAVVMLILLGLLLFWGGVYQYKRGNRKKDSLDS